MKPIFGLMLAVALAGCANWNGIYRTETIEAPDGPRVITIDAKQREVVMVPEVVEEVLARDGHGSPIKTRISRTWRICAEASPDVFSALAASASGALKANVAGKSGELSAALAITESAATIERTQTINLLRESFYRTCERYMSGAITKSAFVVQAGRDWKAMIAILAIEQLTRAARPAPTVLVAGGTSATVTTPQDWVRAIETAQADVRAADANVTTVTEATKPARENKCDTGDAAAIADCKVKKEVAEKQLAAATTRAKEASARLDAVLAGAKNGGGGGGAMATTTSALKPDASPKEGERSASDLATVSADVRAIAMKALEVDEMQLFCIQKLEEPVRPDPKLFDACLELLSESAKFDAAAFKAKITQFEEPRHKQEAEFRTALHKEPAKIKAILSKIPGLGPTATLNFASPNFDTVVKEFMLLTPEQREGILLQISNGD